MSWFRDEMFGVGAGGIADGPWQSPYGAYATAILGNATAQWIRLQARSNAHARERSAQGGEEAQVGIEEARPWFAMLATRAAHEPFVPASWYAETWEAGWPPHEPRPESWNASGAGKHGNLLTQPHLSAAAAAVVTGIFRNRWRTLLSVDDAVAAVVAACGAELEHTFLIFTSDHGCAALPTRLNARGRG